MKFQQTFNQVHSCTDTVSKKIMQQMGSAKVSQCFETDEEKSASKFLLVLDQVYLTKS